MLLVWSHLLWIYFLNWGGWGATGREMRKRFNMCKSFSSPHCATTLEMLKRTGYCCSHSQKCWDAERRKVPLLDFSPCLFLQFPKFWDVLSAQGTKNCLWSLILCCCRFWENSSGETQQARTEVTAVLTPGQQPTGHRSAESQAESAGPWTWGIDHRSAPSERRVWRREENPLSSRIRTK